MTHHRHFVQGGLPVKDDDVAVAHVPLHLVADLKVKVTRFWVETEVDPVPVIADDVFGSGILAVSSPHQLLEPEKGTEVRRLRKLQIR